MLRLANDDLVFEELLQEVVIRPIVRGYVLTVDKTQEAAELRGGLPERAA